jgi:hypothetical protein
MGMLIFGFVLGSLLAIVAVLAIWLALGSWTVMWRAILVIVGASGVALLFCAASGEFEAEWLGLVWVVVVTVTAMFVFVRWLGFRLVDATSHTNRIRSDEWQFSVAQLMGLTGVVAVSSAVGKMLVPLVATMDALIVGSAIAICLGTLALVAAWATLRSATTRIRILTLAVVTIAMSGLVYYGMEATDADPGLVWASVVIMYGIALSKLLLLARSRGFRLLLRSEFNHPQSAVTAPRNGIQGASSTIP